MPFGVKTDGNKKEIDFDKVYHSFIKEAIIKAGLEPIRADEEKNGGFIHKPMYERLMFCDFAVADLSFANANVFYELGIRHALKPFTTVSIFEINTRLPFDTAALRTFPYNYDNEVQDVEKKIGDLAALISRNLDLQKAQQDSPIGQLIQGYQFPNLSYLKQDADAFAEAVKSMQDQKAEINALVKQWKNLGASKARANVDAEKKAIDEQQNEVMAAIQQIETNAGNGLRYNYELLFALIEAYKSVGAFRYLSAMLKPMVDGPFSDNLYIRQQLAFAYNKAKDREAAETILSAIIAQYGPDPETNGLLGAVYKGLMDDFSNDEDLVAEYRRKAVDAYIDGFEADPRNYYPGVNALTLLFLGEDTDERFAKFMPIVTYAVERELRTRKNDYWAEATALELAVLDLNEVAARKYLSAVRTCASQPWMTESTASNLVKIYRKALQWKDTGSVEWLKQTILKLNPQAQGL